MGDSQLGMDWGEVERPAAMMFDPDEIRADAAALIERARAANAAAPWDEATLRYNRILFPHLVSWLPNSEERDQLCFAFTRELDRIEQLLAA